MTSPTFCVNPWVALHSKKLAGYNPCCWFNGTVLSNTVDEYVSSPELKSIKQRLLAGEAIPECSVCWQQEHNGYTSKRQRDNRTYQPIFQALNKDLDNVQGNFVEYYIRLGNHCNLRCTSCNDYLSSGWISENKKFNIATRPVEIISDDHNVWQYMRKHAKTIGAIEFIGGEPFMMSEQAQVDLFKHLIDSNHSNHIKIKYNTNGTRFPKEQIEYWSKFKAIEINVSVDGVGAQFEYLRFPAEWSVLENTLLYYQELQQSIPQLELTIIHTISVANIGYVQDIINYCNQRNINLFLNLLEKPTMLSVFHADESIKKWIMQRIANVNHPVIRSISNNLFSVQGTVSGQEILQFLTTLDQRRNTSVEKTFPELTQCLGLTK